MTVIASVLLAVHLAAGPIVIAHRGASGYLPEHTLEAYALAHAQGADFIEPDLVLTKDKVFICLHDIHLQATTNVEQVFPERKRGDGQWYAADFTLAEIKQLQAEERVAKRFPQGVPGFQVPTFEEMIALVQGLNQTTGRAAGIYPELKSPSWHEESGLPMEEAFLAVCAKHGYAGKDARIFVQCFEPQPLVKMRRELGSELPQIQLISDNVLQANMVSAAGLDVIAGYANGIGPDLRLVEKDPALVERAHARGLQVHPYTLRTDMLPATYTSMDAALAELYGRLKVDGLFTDFPDLAVRHLKGR